MVWFITSFAGVSFRDLSRTKGSNMSFVIALATTIFQAILNMWSIAPYTQQGLKVVGLFLLLGWQTCHPSDSEVVSIVSTLICSVSKA